MVVGLLDLFIKNVLVGSQHIEDAAGESKGCLQLAQTWKQLPDFIQFGKNPLAQ